MHSLHEPDPPNVRGGPFLPQTQPPSCMTLDMQSVTSREWRQNSSCAYICPSFSSFSSRTATVLVDIARLEIEIVELKPGRRESGNQDMKARCNCIPTGYKQTSRPESGTNHMRQITSAKSNLIRQLLNFNLELVIFCHQHTYPTTLTTSSVLRAAPSRCSSTQATSLIQTCDVWPMSPPTLFISLVRMHRAFI